MNRVEAIIELINSGVPAKEIAEQTECNVQNVYGIARRYGLKIAKKAHKHDAEVKRLREQGFNYKQIGEAIGVDRKTIRITCKRLGCELTDAERQKIIEKRAKAGGLAIAEKQRHTEEQVAELIREANKGVEYVSGYTNDKGTMIVRCLKCGSVFERKYFSVVNNRNSTVHCDACAEDRRIKAECEKEEQRKEREKQRKEREQQREREREEQERKKAERIHACPVCGEITGKPKYCSIRCRNRASNKRGEIRRRMRYKGGDNITIEALTRRDSGVCYICGLAVNENDYDIHDGVFIAGNYYPSIDHVIPISYGGKHIWENVRLTHRICNMVKSNKINFVTNIS